MVVVNHVLIKYDHLGTGQTFLLSKSLSFFGTGSSVLLIIFDHLIAYPDRAEDQVRQPVTGKS